jgi:hypothetical protein
VLPLPTSPPFTAVTLVRTEAGRVLVARNGKALGYVAEAKPVAAPIMARALEILAERMEPTAAQ